MVILFLIFWGTVILFLIVAAPFIFPPTVHKGSFFSKSLLTLVISCLFDNSHCEVWGDISLWFWFAFPWQLAMLSIFSCTCWPCACLLWKKCLLSSSAHFKITLFVCFCFCFAVELYEFLIYILDINPKSDIRFAKTFSHSISCLFIWLIVSFAVQKLLSLV